MLRSGPAPVCARQAPTSGGEPRPPSAGADHGRAAGWGATCASQNNRKSWLLAAIDFGYRNSDAGDNGRIRPEQEAAANRGALITSRGSDTPSPKACSPPPLAAPGHSLAPAPGTASGPHGPTAGRAGRCRPREPPLPPRPKHFSPFRPGPAASPRRSPQRSTPAGSCQWPAPPPPSPPPSSLPPAPNHRRQGRDTRNRARPAALPGEPTSAPPPPGTAAPPAAPLRPAGHSGRCSLSPPPPAPPLPADGAHRPGPWCGSQPGAGEGRRLGTPAPRTPFSSPPRRSDARGGGGHLPSRWQSRVASTSEAS